MIAKSTERRRKGGLGSVDFPVRRCWIYKWFRLDGKIPADRLAAEMQDLFFGGLEIPPVPAKRARRPRRPKAAKRARRARGGAVA
jgi:hypothetical protein